MTPSLRERLEAAMLEAWDRSAPPEMRVLPPQCRQALAAAVEGIAEGEIKEERDTNALLTPYIRAQASARIAAEAERDAFRLTVDETAREALRLNELACDERDALTARVEALKGALKNKDQIAWLIESDGPPTQYLGTMMFHGKIANETLVGWTTDVNAAIRFCRKEDAARGATLVFRDYQPKIVEHMWCAALLTPTGAPDA